MGRATPMQASFNAGEISPLMMGRLDQAVYSIAGEKMENFVPLIQGPMLKRSGLRHVAVAKGPCRLIDFEPFVTQGYMIEAGELYFRFYTNNAQILDGDGDPYEIAAPYSYEETLELDMTGSADVVYLVHGSHAPRTLARTGAETFSLSLLALTGGPFDDDNIDESITVSASASTGDVFLYASADIFEPGHVGGLFKMEARDLAEVPAWEPDISVNSDEQRQWDGKVYLKVGGTGRTGTVPPIHSEGVEWDGMGSGTRADGTTAAGGVQWLYVHDRYGVLNITAYETPRKVAATVLKRLPGNAAAANSYVHPIGYEPAYTGSETVGGALYFRRYEIVEDGLGGFTYNNTGGDYVPPTDALDYTTPGTWRWAFGAFSEAKGWPEKVYVWNERLIFTKGSTGYASVVGAYTDFRERNESGEITADMAFRFTLNSPNAVRWLAGDEQLLIGTAKKEHVGAAMAGGGIAGPGNFKAPAQSDFGSAAVKPVNVGGRVLFVEKAGRRIHQLDFAFERDRYDAPDLTVTADHVTRSGVRWMARQAAPHSLVWCGMEDGTLAAMSYSPTQEVKSWCRCPLAEGGAVRWGACIPDPQGKLDQLWLAVERDGQWLIGYIEQFWEDGDAVVDAFFVDHGLSYDGAPISAIVGGLDHLAGETVRVLGDGRDLGSFTVGEDGGIADLGGSYSKVHAGLFNPALFKSLRIEAGGDDGTAQGKIKRISQIVIRVHASAGLRARVQGGDWQYLDSLTFGGALEEPTPLFTGDWVLETIGDYDREGQVEIESIAPLPACILSLTPTIKVGSR